MVSLDRCMAVLLSEKVEADRAGLRTFRPDAMAGGFLSVLWHQGFELGLGSFMVEKGRAGGAEEPGEFRPGVRFAHVDHPNRLDPRARSLEAIGARGLTGLHAAPKSLFGGDREMLVERVSMDADFDPLAAATDDGQHPGAGVGDPHVVLELGH